MPRHVSNVFRHGTSKPVLDERPVTRLGNPSLRLTKVPTTLFQVLHLSFQAWKTPAVALPAICGTFAKVGPPPRSSPNPHNLAAKRLLQLA